jgi:hypothetical protein
VSIDCFKLLAPLLPIFKLFRPVEDFPERFDAAKIGISCDQALAAMYGQYHNGVLIQGVTVFSEAYRRADLPFLAWIFSRKRLQAILQAAYRFFAKNRHAISRLLGPTALYLVRATASKDTS